ncbi:MAG: hypothetical protein CM15mP102_20460 [Flavobacteriales bacterium]|nr:MAG: hypothetical protein CM15mP102_20460 [Flavobacteriales bacterium]
MNLISSLMTFLIAKPKKNQPNACEDQQLKHTYYLVFETNNFPL